MRKADGTASVQPFAPDEERDNGPRRDTPRRFKSFAPHGAGNSSSTNASGTATPITSGLGYHKSGPRTAAREIDGVVTWGGGFAPLFVKAGELFRDGEVDVVKRDGGEFLTVLHVRSGIYEHCVPCPGPWMPLISAHSAESPLRGR